MKVVNVSSTISGHFLKIFIMLRTTKLFYRFFAGKKVILTIDKFTESENTIAKTIRRNSL